MTVFHSTPLNYVLSLPSQEQAHAVDTRSGRSAARHHAVCPLLQGDEREQLLCLARSRLPAPPSCLLQATQVSAAPPAPSCPGEAATSPITALTKRHSGDRLGAGGFPAGGQTRPGCRRRSEGPAERGEANASPRTAIPRRRSPRPVPETETGSPRQGRRRPTEPVTAPHPAPPPPRSAPGRRPFPRSRHGSSAALSLPERESAR